MPKVSSYFVRTALIWFAIGSTIGSLMLINKGIAFWPALWAWRWAHVHTLLIGWIIQLACGVAIWMLPRPQISGWRGDPRYLWLCYGLLNLGIVCAMLPSSLQVFGFTQSFELLYSAAGLAYAAALLLWVVLIWPRIIPTLREREA